MRGPAIRDDTGELIIKDSDSVNEAEILRAHESTGVDRTGRLRQANGTGATPKIQSTLFSGARNRASIVLNQET